MSLHDPSQQLVPARHVWQQAKSANQFPFIGSHVHLNCSLDCGLVQEHHAPASPTMGIIKMDMRNMNILRMIRHNSLRLQEHIWQQATSADHIPVINLLSISGVPRSWACAGASAHDPRNRRGVHVKRWLCMTCHNSLCLHEHIWQQANLQISLLLTTDISMSMMPMSVGSRRGIVLLHHAPASAHDHGSH